jgi:hypothetical protein
VPEPRGPALREPGPRELRLLQYVRLPSKKIILFLIEFYFIYFFIFY